MTKDFLKSDIAQKLQDKSIWLFSSPVQPNETLNSWVARNFISNYQQPTQSMNSLLGRYSSQNIDLDLRPETELFSFLDQRSIIDSGFNVAIQNTEVLRTLKKMGTNNLVIPFGSKQSNNNCTQQYCPNCLDQTTSYYQYHWRLSIIFGCIQCGCRLQSACGSCSRAINPFKLNPIRENRLVNINECYACGNPISQGERTPLDDQETQTMKWIQQCFTHDANKTTIRLISELIDIISGNSKISHCVREHFGLKKPAYPFLYLPINDRIRVLITIHKWLERFYHEIVQINERYSLTRKHWATYVNLTSTDLHP